MTKTRNPQGWPIQGMCPQCSRTTLVWEDGFCSQRCRTRYQAEHPRRHPEPDSACRVCGEPLWRNGSNGRIPEYCAHHKQMAARTRREDRTRTVNASWTRATRWMARMAVDLERRRTCIEESTARMTGRSRDDAARVRVIALESLTLIARHDPGLVEADPDGFITGLRETIDSHGAYGDADTLLARMGAGRTGTAWPPA